jgi:hypothetical protein
MSASQSPIFKPAVLRSGTPHLHLKAEACPVCDQPIPDDRFDEIQKRMEARERERAAEITNRLQEQYASEKLEALAEAERKAAAVLELARQAADEKVLKATEEARIVAEAAARETIAVSERASEQARVALEQRLASIEIEKNTAEELRTALHGQLVQVRQENEEAVQRLKADAALQEAHIRAEAIASAETTIQTRISDLERQRVETEEAFQTRLQEIADEKALTQQANATLQSSLDQLRAESEAAFARMQQEAAERESTVRQEVSAAAEAAASERIAQLELARQEAEAKAATAQEQILGMSSTHETQMSQRLGEQREALEQAKAEAVNAEKSAAFAEKLKLSTKVEELQRTLDKKTAEELGEGAEIDLFEALKSEFESDRIERVNKGQPGADIIHVVIHNGIECGRIVYDSKNHNAWRNDFITKLASDKMAAKAEHAILSTRKFPAGERHLHLQDGIVLASPSRVVAVVQIIRQHIVHTHSLRLSNEERTQKTAALYDYITSERCADLFSRFDTHADDLLDVQEKEKRAHDATWKKQGELIRAVQKVKAQMQHEIDMIITTSAASE